jgi:hypothetical protein
MLLASFQSQWGPLTLNKHWEIPMEFKRNREEACPSFVGVSLILKPTTVIIIQLEHQRKHTQYNYTKHNDKNVTLSITLC